MEARNPSVRLSSFVALHLKNSTHPSDRWHRLALIGVLACGAALIIWTSLGRWEIPQLGSRQLDYYNLLVSGFRKGSLALDIEVPPELRQARDPIALLAKSPELAPHDVSYYRGHFYTYYGVVPAVVLFWPFRALTGRELPLVLGFLMFALGAFAGFATLWLCLVRDHFPRAGWITKIAGVAALSLAAGQLVLARRVSIWEPSIEAGDFFLVGMLLCAYFALRSRRPSGWLVGAGVALGLAAGSRPTLVVAGVALVPLVVAVAWRKEPDEAPAPGRRLLQAVLAAGAPLAAIGLALLAYNWARFGDPLELGLNYQLSVWNEVKRSHFLPANIPFNAFLYFLASPQWGRYFPFVHPIAYPKLPAGYYGYEYVYGALLTCPVLWWGAALPAFARRARPALRPFIAVVLAIAVATTLVIFSFDTAAARYETDFLPWWMLLALLGWAFLEDRLGSAERGATLGPLRIVFGLTSAVSCVLAFCCSAELHEILQNTNPGAYRSLSRVFNIPTFGWEALSGNRGGAIEMNLVFAPRPRESVEPLVVTGVEYQRDYAYLYYQSDRVVRFCYVHPGEPVASSADVTIEPGRSYSLRVQCGSLYPPEGHLAYRGWQPEEIAALKRWVEIDLDGRPVVVAQRGANEASPGSVQVGVDAGIGFCGRRFAGSISGVRRVKWTRPIGDLSSAGDFDLVVALPVSPPPVNEPPNSPLVEAGRSGQADIVGLTIDPAKRYRFVLESWGSGLARSAFFDLPENPIASFRVRLGPTLRLDAASPLAILSRSVVVWKEGAPIWWHRTPTPAAANPPCYLFSNGVGSTAMEASFPGRVIAASRSPPPRWRKGPFLSLELGLGGRGAACEPLVATGTTGRSDTLAIEWLAGRRARLVYRHWGREALAGEPFGWADQDPKDVRLEMPSFASLDRAGMNAGEGRLRVWINERLAWDAEVPFFGAASESLSIGRNPSGCAAVAAELSSVVIDARQKSGD